MSTIHKRGEHINAAVVLPQPSIDSQTFYALLQTCEQRGHIFGSKMTKLFAFAITLIYAIGYVEVTDTNNRYLELFTFDPKDVFTLPKDVDEEKPAVQFSGDVQKSKVEHLQNLNGNKKFKLDLKTQNGIEISQVGKLKDDKTFVVSGSYSFTGVDGRRYRTRYTADEFGYHPITKLELDIPDPIPVPVKTTKDFTRQNAEDKITKNRFKFLNQFLNLGSTEKHNDQSIDGYSYSPPTEEFLDNIDLTGYDYSRPENIVIPSRGYLPVE